MGNFAFFFFIAALVLGYYFYSENHTAFPMKKEPTVEIREEPAKSSDESREQPKLPEPAQSAPVVTSDSVTSSTNATPAKVTEGVDTKQLNEDHGKADQRAKAVGEKIAEVKLKDGSVLQDTEIKGVYDDGIVFKHSTGVSRIDFSNLPQDLIVRFEMDEASAKKALAVRLAEKLKAAKALADAQVKEAETTVKTSSNSPVESASTSAPSVADSKPAASQPERDISKLRAQLIEAYEHELDIRQNKYDTIHAMMSPQNWRSSKDATFLGNRSGQLYERIQDCKGGTTNAEVFLSDFFMNYFSGSDGERERLSELRRKIEAQR